MAIYEHPEIKSWGSLAAQDVIKDKELVLWKANPDDIDE